MSSRNYKEEIIKTEKAIAVLEEKKRIREENERLEREQLEKERQQLEREEKERQRLKIEQLERQRLKRERERQVIEAHKVEQEKREKRENEINTKKKDDNLLDDKKEIIIIPKSNSKLLDFFRFSPDINSVIRPLITKNSNVYVSAAANIQHLSGEILVNGDSLIGEIFISGMKTYVDSHYRGIPELKDSLKIWDLTVRLRSTREDSVRFPLKVFVDFISKTYKKYGLPMAPIAGHLVEPLIVSALLYIYYIIVENVGNDTLAEKIMEMMFSVVRIVEDTTHEGSKKVLTFLTDLSIRSMNYCGIINEEYKEAAGILFGKVFKIMRDKSEFSYEIQTHAIVGLVTFFIIRIIEKRNNKPSLKRDTDLLTQRKEAIDRTYEVQINKILREKIILFFVNIHDASSDKSWSNTIDQSIFDAACRKHHVKNSNDGLRNRHDMKNGLTKTNLINFQSEYTQFKEEFDSYITKLHRMFLGYQKRSTEQMKDELKKLLKWDGKLYVEHFSEIFNFLDYVPQHKSYYSRHKSGMLYNELLRHDNVNKGIKEKYSSDVLTNYQKLAKFEMEANKNSNEHDGDMNVLLNELDQLPKVNLRNERWKLQGFIFATIALVPHLNEIQLTKSREKKAF